MGQDFFDRQYTLGNKLNYWGQGRPDFDGWICYACRTEAKHHAIKDNTVVLYCIIFACYYSPLSDFAVSNSCHTELMWPI